MDVAVLALDLLLFHPEERPVGMAAAGVWPLVRLVPALAFGGLLWAWLGDDAPRRRLRRRTQPLGRQRRRLRLRRPDGIRLAVHELAEEPFLVFAANAFAVLGLGSPVAAAAASALRRFPGGESR